MKFSAVKSGSQYILCNPVTSQSEVIIFFNGLGRSAILFLQAASKPIEKKMTSGRDATRTIYCESAFSQSHTQLMLILGADEALVEQCRICRAFEAPAAGTRRGQRGCLDALTIDWAVAQDWQNPVSGLDRLPQGLRQGAPPLAVVCVTSNTSPCIPRAIDGKGHAAMEDQTRYTHALQRGCDLIVCFMK